MATGVAMGRVRGGGSGRGRQPELLVIIGIPYEKN